VIEEILPTLAASYMIWPLTHTINSRLTRMWPHLVDDERPWRALHQGAGAACSREQPMQLLVVVTPSQRLQQHRSHSSAPKQQEAQRRSVCSSNTLYAATFLPTSYTEGQRPTLTRLLLPTASPPNSPATSVPLSASARAQHPLLHNAYATAELPSQCQTINRVNAAKHKAPLLDQAALAHCQAPQPPSCQRAPCHTVA
jgi:hypothetical protein